MCTDTVTPAWDREPPRVTENGFMRPLGRRPEPTPGVLPYSGSYSSSSASCASTSNTPATVARR